jgi:hypothetical protein
MSKRKRSDQLSLEPDLTLHPKDRVPPEAYGMPQYVWFVTSHTREANQAYMYIPRMYKTKKHALEMIELEAARECNSLNFYMLKKSLSWLAFRRIYLYLLGKQTATRHHSMPYIATIHV